MKHTIKQFYQSVDVLANAYRSGTLVSGSCTACAVGNLVASAYGYGFKPDRQQYLRWTSELGEFVDYDELVAWYHASGICDKSRSTQHSSLLNIIGTIQSNKIGYSFEEILAIENAFERRDSLGLNSRLQQAIYALGKIHDIPESEIARVIECTFNQNHEYEPHN